MPRRKPANPFYVLLVLTGILFFITASAYGVMTVKGLYPEVVETSGEENRAPGGQSGLLDWLDENGFRLLMVELVVLAIFTFAAIGTDSYWQQRRGTIAAASTKQAKTLDQPDH